MSKSRSKGHNRMPEQVSAVALGESLTLEKCRRLGMIFHAMEISNYESIRGSANARLSTSCMRVERSRLDSERS